MPPSPTAETAAAPRRRYDSSLRRQRAAETRTRIVEAGSALLRGSSVRDWQGLTIRAVAERAGVNERTVYRHFTNEQGLHDAVMHRLEEEAGIELHGMRLDDLAGVTARIFEHVATFPADNRPPLDPTLMEAKRRQHEALLSAVAVQAESWPAGDRTVVAAIFDVLWSVAAYERLVVDWGIEPGQATRGIAWLIELLRQAVTASPDGLPQPSP